MNLLNTCPGNPVLFCLFSKGMSEGALSPPLIHLLPLVYVTDGDLGPHYSPSTSTPSDSPTNLCRKEDCLLVCLQFLSFFFSSFGQVSVCVSVKD